MSKFIVDNLADASWTHSQGSLTTSYAILQQLLGDPNSFGDEYKVSTEWVLRNVEEGYAVTIHDYKQTNLYHDEYPTVEEFRAQEEYDWTIGAKKPEHARALVMWLNEVISQRLTHQNRDIPHLTNDGIVGV